MVASKKGAKGGYFLAVAPEKLTMKQVIELMEGPIVLSRCIGSPEVCSQQATNQANCRFRHIFQEVGETVARTLDGVTIASLTRIDGKARDATNEI